MSDSESSVTILGCGDVGPVHGPVEPYSEFVRSTLLSADIRFAHCDRLCSDKGHLQVAAGKFGRATPDMISVFSDCGFNVVSLAGNLALDWGEEALLDTMERFHALGIKTIGAGRNIDEARKPAIFDCNGVRVAMLAYSSVTKEGHMAEKDKVGVASIRIHTSFEQEEYQAGLPPRIVTTAYEQDLKHLIEDIEQAKRAVDVVIVSLHWGLHYIPRMIAEYQPVLAKAIFDAGAGLILGHHPHVPKAIGVHDGKVCFYSLGNFIFTTHSGATKAWAERFARRYGVQPDVDEFPTLPFGTDSKRSLIAKAVVTAAGVKTVSYLPAHIDKALRPELLHSKDPRFQDNVAFMDWASEGFDHAFSVAGNEVVIRGN